MTIDDMWERLAQHQPYADQRGYGEAWARMCEEKTSEAAEAAKAADVWETFDPCGLLEKLVEVGE